MMSELSLSKIQTLSDTKLLRNFSYGSRAKTFLPLNPSNFCPLAKIFYAVFFQFLKFMSSNVPSIKEVLRGKNLGEPIGRTFYAVLGVVAASFYFPHPETSWPSFISFV